MPLPALIIPALMTGLGVLGTVSKMKAAQFQSQTEQFEAQYAQRVNEFNAQVSLQNAQLIEQSALLERVRAGKVKEAFLGLQRAQFAKAGVRTTGGTPFEVLVDTAAELELDIQVDFFNSQVAAHAQRTQASLDLASASVSKFNQITAKQKGKLGATTAFLEGLPGTARSGATLASALKIPGF